MAICEGCGSSFDDAYKFCPQCGRSKPTPQTININLHVTSDDVWETCEIVHVDGNDTVFGYHFQYYAEAIGPKGKYIAAKIRPVVPGKRFNEDPDDRSPARTKAYNDLIGQLVALGWEPTGSRGSNWWNDRFRRRVPPDWEAWDEGEIMHVAASKKIFEIKEIWGLRLTGRKSRMGETIILASSAPFKSSVQQDENKNKPDVLNSYQDFLALLQGDGWKLLPVQGDSWFSKRFIRRSKK